jgi:hypothetical protein
MDGRGAVERLSLPDLVEPSQWQRLQDHFANVLGIPIRTINPSHQLLVNPSWPPSLEAERAISMLKIGEELEQLVPVAEPPPNTSSLTTPLGITYAVVPIRTTSQRIIGYFIIGPVVVGSREDELQFRQRVSARGLDAQSLWPVILSLKLYTFAGIRSALNLLEEVGSSIVQLAYQAKQLAVILPATGKVDQAVVNYYTDRILHSLLEAATLATKADGGSVMIYDARSDALQIKAAHGLSDAIMASTRVKRGERIAGLAAAQRNILLIDKQIADERIKGLMERPELVASLVAPLIPDPAQEPIGVLNLRTTDPQRRFTAEHVELLRRLLDLAGAALGSLRFAFSQAQSSPSS